MCLRSWSCRCGLLFRPAANSPHGAPDSCRVHIASYSLPDLELPMDVFVRRGTTHMELPMHVERTSRVIRCPIWSSRWMSSSGREHPTWSSRCMSSACITFLCLTWSSRCTSNVHHYQLSDWELPPVAEHVEYPLETFCPIGTSLRRFDARVCLARPGVPNK